MSSPRNESTPILSDASAGSSGWAAHPVVRMFICISGVIGMLGAYGFLQERIMSRPYGLGEGAEYFKYSVFLVFVNRIVSSIYAGTEMYLTEKPLSADETKKSAPLWKYAIVSASNTAATTCQYESLLYISFPLQMLGKCFKMVPVMGWGMLASGKSYAVADWLIAAAVTLGCMMFLTFGDVRSDHSTEEHAIHAVAWGVLLLLGYLAFDGLTPTYQEKILTDHNTSTAALMFYVNIISCAISLLSLLSFGLFVPSISFVMRHPIFLVHVLQLSLCATFGQVFIYRTISWFGALALAAVMNLRQLGSVLFSVLYYGHTVNVLQWVGIATCFGGLFAKTARGYHEHLLKEAKPAPQRDIESEASPEADGARFFEPPRDASVEHLTRKRTSA